MQAIRTPDSEGYIPLDHFSRFVHSQLICRVSVSMTIWKIFNFLFGPNEAWWNSGHCPGNSCTCFGFHTWLWLVRPLNTSALLLVRKCTLYFWYGDALRIKLSFIWSSAIPTYFMLSNLQALWYGIFISRLIFIWLLEGENSRLLSKIRTFKDYLEHHKAL